MFQKVIVINNKGGLEGFLITCFFLHHKDIFSLTRLIITEKVSTVKTIIDS